MFQNLMIFKCYFTATSYVAATGGALVTALGLNSLVKHSPPLIGRFVPFCAVAAANCVNIPLMRQLELKNGESYISKSKRRELIIINYTPNQR